MKSEPSQKLIFIYNADSGLRNKVVDTVHKIMSPLTYNCNLCSLTFDMFTENKVWKRFRKENQYEMEFLHKNEFKRRYASKFGYKFSYPIVLVTSANSFEILIGTEELNAIGNVEDLIIVIRNRTKI